MGKLKDELCADAPADLVHDPLCPKPVGGRICLCDFAERVRGDQIEKLNATWQPILREAELRGFDEGLRTAHDAVSKCLFWDDTIVKVNDEPVQYIWRHQALDAIFSARRVS